MRPPRRGTRRRPATRGGRGFDPTQVGWRIGSALHPAGAGELWAPWERTAGVLGPQGAGKTLDLLVPALLQAPGAALVTTTKTQDVALTLTARARTTGPSSCWTRSGWRPGCPGWCGTPSPAARTR